jgi:UDPglucose 6-dehydrogenase
MKLGIMGVGFVGGATAEVLGEKHELILYDKYKEEYNKFSEELIEAEVVFICVPTPMKPSGEIDYSAIHDSIRLLEKITRPKEQKPLVVIRSTAVSGTTEELNAKYPFNFAFNPEFLKEKSAVEDMKKTDRIVIGVSSEEDFEKILEVYKPLFPNAKYIKTDTKTAEMIKYSANVMLAGQIALANEIYQICNNLGIDYEKVKETILLDERIARNIDVPGPDGSLGFGGKCFPKDLNALIYLARKTRYRPYLLEEVWRLNEHVRQNKDWLDIPGATSKNKNFTKD